MGVLRRVEHWEGGAFRRQSIGKMEHRKGKHWKGGTLRVGSIGRSEPWSLGRGSTGKGGM